MKNATNKLHRIIFCIIPTNWIPPLRKRYDATFAKKTTTQQTDLDRPRQNDQRQYRQYKNAILIPYDVHSSINTSCRRFTIWAVWQN